MSLLRRRPPKGSVAPDLKLAENIRGPDTISNKAELFTPIYRLSALRMSRALIH